MSANEETNDVEAHTVFLIVRDCSLFPRSERIPWFFKHLQGPDARLQIHNEDCTAEIVGIQSSDGQIFNLLDQKSHYDSVNSKFPSFIIDSNEKNTQTPTQQLSTENTPFYITPSTQLVQLCYKYRIVFSLDVTPSMAAIDPVTGEVLFDQVLVTLEKCLLSLVDAPVSFPGIKVKFQPQIYVSVVAQGFLAETLRVLLQGALLERHLIPSIMSSLKLKLRAFESHMATIYSTGVASSTPLYKRAVSELASCVHKSVFALKLLPPDACPSLILIGDGVTSAPDLTAYDNMTMLLNREDITCTTILVGSGPHLHCAFGYTPDTEILRHLSTSTCGAYIERSYLPAGSALRELLLLKNFSPSPSPPSGSTTHPYISTLLMDGEAVVNDMGALHTMMAVDYPFPWVGPPPMVPLLQTQHKTYEIECDLPRLVDVRVREGFVVTAATVDDSIAKDKILSIRLVISWLPNIKIAYTIQVFVGPKGPHPILKVELIVLAYYEFLHQFMKNEKGAQSQAAVSVSKLQSFLASIHETDVVLSYLYRQSQSPASPSPSPAPAPAIHVTPQILQAQYKAFWKAMNSLRNHSWHRWLKTEKIGLILSPLISVLDPDYPVLGQFPLPRPRAVYPAHFLYDPPTAILLDYCTRWATFNQSKQLFVKFLDPPPGITSSLLPSPSFCVIRLSFETSGFVIMQLAFFSTGPVARADTISTIKRELAALAYPADISERDIIGANPMSTNRAISVGPPVTPISRSIRTMLVRYDPLPVHSSQPPPHHSPARLVFNHSASPLPSFSPLLAWYMWRHRWVWNLPDSSISEQLVGIIIECRLREGFTLVNVAYGIYTFIKELSLYTPQKCSHPRVALPCTLQYLLFVATPHTLTTELWMEPQCGRYVHSRGESTEAELFTDLRSWLEGTDTKVISALSTLYLLDSADIRDKKLDLSNYPIPAPPPSQSTPSAYSLVHPTSISNPPRRLDYLSQFAMEKFDRSYPLIQSNDTEDNDKTGGAHSENSPIKAENQLLDAANDRLYSMVADCVAWLSDYEVLPDKSVNDEFFKRGRSFVKIIRAHPVSPPHSTYASPLLATRLVISHIRPSRGARKSVDISFYVMSADAFKCPPVPTSPAAERVSNVFSEKDVVVISTDEEEDERETEEESENEEEEDTQDENRAAQTIVTEYLTQIHQAYRRCFAKAMYTHLRSYGSITTQDFTEFVDVLHPTHLDVDLSEFLNVISNPSTTGSQPSYTDIQAQFNSELALYFIPVPLPGSPYFVYHHVCRLKANGKATYDSGDEGETYGYDKKADMEYDPPYPDVHDSSSLELCPPFIGEMEGDADSKDPTGMYPLPLVMRMEAIKEGESPITVTTIPTPDLGPIPPTCLRLVCLVLPPLLGPSKLVHESICTILHKHKKRIVALQSAKILSSLLSIRPLSDSTLDIVMRHLVSLSAPVSSKNPVLSRYVRCTTLELQFVDRTEGNERFPQELKNSKPSPSTSPDNPAVVRLSGDLYAIVTRPSSSPDGIQADDAFEYWLLLVCKTDAVVATLFSPLGFGEDTDPNKEIWTAIKAGIGAVSRRVNQLILLDHLHESRICAELLLPLESRTPPTPSLRGSVTKEEKGDGKGRAHNFRPGEFECPLVHTITLPLHDRITPATAHSLMLTALHPFDVANHSTLFVYHQKNGRIFYFCLHTAATIQSTTTPSNAAPQVTSAQANPVPQEAPQQTSPPPSPSLPTHTLSPACVTLNVYGVDQAGPEITQHLHQHLELKLSSHTLTFLSKLFMRNPLLKLTTEDLDFIRPPPLAPSPTGPRASQNIAIQVPTFVDEPYIFLLFLKHNLMQFLQAVHLSQAAQQREDSNLVPEPMLAHDRVDIRASEFMLMYNHISAPTSAAPFTAIGQGMACIELALLDTNSNCLTTVPRPSFTRTYKDWTREDLQAILLPEAPELASYSACPTSWSHRVLFRISSRGSVNIQALTNHLVICTNQAVCEYVLETSLLPPSTTISLDTLPAFMHNAALILSHARTLSTPSVHESVISLPMSSWACHSFLSDMRTAIAETKSIPGLQVYTCNKGMDGTLRCVASYYSSSTRSSAESGGNQSACDCELDDCAYDIANSDFYHYGGEPEPDNTSNEDLDLVSSMLTCESSFFILGGKKVEATHPMKVAPDQNTELFYPVIKDSQLSEPVQRHCIIAVQLDAPRDYEQGYKMTLYTYNWDPTKLDNLKERCSRLVSLYTLRQHLVVTISHHKLGLFHHQSLPPNTSQALVPAGASKLTWENIDSIVVPPPLTSTRRRTTSSSGNQDDKRKEDLEALELDHKKSRPDIQRPVRPALDFDGIFSNHYPTTVNRNYTKDPVTHLVNQSRALALYIEQSAAQRTTAISSISILPSPSNTSSSPLTSHQLDSVINIARLVHFRCVPFLFGDQLLEFKPTDQPSLPVIDAFVRDYVGYLEGLGVSPLLVERVTPVTSTKRISARAYLQKVFLDGTLLVKISFREASVACELFSVPRFSSHSARHFGEELTRFTRILHLNSFTYDFHVNQLYRMIKFPYVPAATVPSKQSISSILQALHQYYPTPPIHASTCLDSFATSCPVQHLSPEIPEISTNQVLEFMMTDRSCMADSIVPLHHIGVVPALLISAPPVPLYSDVCGVVFAEEAIPEVDEDCGCPPIEETDLASSLQLKLAESAELLVLHVFVVKVGEVCTTDVTNSPSDNTALVEKLNKSVAASSIHFQRNQLWNKLQRGNPYSPALTHTEFQILIQLILSRSATLLDPTLTQPINILKLGSGVWHQLLAQLRTVGGERVRQVFADPIHHLLIFHPTNQAQLVHFVWNESEKEAQILMCRLDKSSVGYAASDDDEAAHLSQLITVVCHFIWKLFLVKPLYI